MVKVVGNFLMMKKTMKELEMALSSGDKESLLRAGNILIMNSENLSLEIMRYANKAKV